MTVKFHLVSAHFGGEPPWIHNIQSKHNYTYQYYTDQNTPSRSLSMHPRLKAKIPKMLEWQTYDADWYIWLDSSCKIKPGVDLPDVVLSTSAGNPLCLFRHTQGRNIREEAKCVRTRLAIGDSYFNRRYSGEPILEQLTHYYGDREFCDNRLFQMSCFAYHRSAKNLMLNWFLENCRWSIEDQISFPYVLQKSGLTYSLFEGTATENSLFHWDIGAREIHLQRTPEQPNHQ